MTEPAVDTEALIHRARCGDDAAAGELLRGFRSRLKQMIRARMDPRIAGRVDPSDVVQETFVVAFKQLPKYLATQPIPFYPWLRRIAWQNLVHLHEHHLDALKRSVKRERRDAWGVSDHSAAQLAQLIAGPATSPSRAAVRRELRSRVAAALDQLTALDREVLLQRYLEQLSIKEIAAVLNASEAAIQMRHMRALQKLQRLLENDSC